MIKLDILFVTESPTIYWQQAIAYWVFLTQLLIM